MLGQDASEAVALQTLAVKGIRQLLPPENINNN